MLIRKDICPKCGAGVDAATNFEDGTAKPERGDFSICAYCGAILVFDDELFLRSVGQELLNSLPSDEMAYLNRLSSFVKNQPLSAKDRRILDVLA